MTAILRKDIIVQVAQPVTPAGARVPDIGLVEINVPQKPGPIGPPGPGVVISDTPPADPKNGTQWWESDTGRLYHWYDDGSSAQWVQSVAPTTAVAVNAGEDVSAATVTATGGSVARTLSDWFAGLGRAGLGTPEKPPARDFWIDQGAGANIWRFADRVFVGGGAEYTGAWSTVTFADRSWLGEVTAGDAAGNLQYLERDATFFAVSDNSGVAVSAAVRTSDSVIAPSTGTGINAIGISSIGYADGTTLVDGLGHKIPVYTYYGEAIREPGAGTVLGFELETANLEADALFINPYSIPTDGMSGGLWLGCGASKANAQPATFGIYTIGNGSRFKKGLIFGDNSLVKDGGGYATAIEMASKHQIVWKYSGSEAAIGGFIESSNNNIATATGIDFGPNGFAVTDLARKWLFRVTNVANAVNYVNVVPAITAGDPTILANGTDANVRLVLRTRGNSSMLLQGGSGTTKFAVSDTGLAFHGTSPVAKPTISGSRAGNAALASLLTQLAAIGLVTDSTTA